MLAKAIECSNCDALRIAPLDAKTRRVFIVLAAHVEALLDRLLS